MPFKRDTKNYFIAPTVPGFGKLRERSTGSRKKSEAEALEQLLKDLPRRGYSRLVEMYVDKRLDPQVLLGKHREEALDELLEDSVDPPLADVIEDVRPLITDERVLTGLTQLGEYAVRIRRKQVNEHRAARDQPPLGAEEPLVVRFSWIQQPVNVQAVCRAAIADGRKPNSVLRSLFRAISDLLRLRLGDAAKTAILKKLAPGEDDRRNVVLSRKQIQTVVQLCRARGLNLAIVALLTGIDRGPLLRAQVRHWDSEARVLAVPDTKAATRFRLLDMDELTALLLDQAAEGKKESDRLFPWSEAEVRDAWERVREDAGVPELRLKDLRHVFAASFLRGGGKLRDLREVMGHASFKTTLRYVGFERSSTPEQMAAARVATGLTLEHLEAAPDGSAEPRDA